MARSRLDDHVLYGVQCFPCPFKVLSTDHHSLSAKAGGSDRHSSTKTHTSMDLVVLSAAHREHMVEMRETNVGLVLLQLPK